MGSMLLTLASCGDDGIQLPDNDLEGRINGEAWASDKASAYPFSSDQKFKIRFLSSEEPGSDPCSAPSPSKPYLSAVFKPGTGSYSFSTVVLDPNQVQVRLHQSFSTDFIITNGFMEIYGIERSIMYGYIQAILDDDNTVEGSFEINFCN